VGLRRRLDLISAFVSNSRDFPFPLGELIKGLLRPPCTYLAPRYIAGLHQTDEDWRVNLRSLTMPLYWPRALPRFNLYMVITEGMNADDWHFYEVPETQVLPGDVVLDCGAAEGLFSLRTMKRAGQVVAFEPAPMFVRSLHRTFADAPNVTIVPCALGGIANQVFLKTGSIDSHVSREGQGVPVSMTTIDQWVQHNDSRVDLIKGDLEGFELEVLRGAAQTIKRYRPKIAFTVYHPGNDWKEMVSFCRSLAPDYHYRIKGLSFLDRRIARPVMLHLWV